MTVTHIDFFQHAVALLRELVFENIATVLVGDAAPCSWREGDYLFVQVCPTIDGQRENLDACSWCGDVFKGDEVSCEESSGDGVAGFGIPGEARVACGDATDGMLRNVT